MTWTRTQSLTQFEVTEECCEIFCCVQAVLMSGNIWEYIVSCLVSASVLGLSNFFHEKFLIENIHTTTTSTIHCST